MCSSWKILIIKVLLDISILTKAAGGKRLVFPLWG